MANAIRNAITIRKTKFCGSLRTISKITSGTIYPKTTKQSHLMHNLMYSKFDYSSFVIQFGRE